MPADGCRCIDCFDRVPHQLTPQDEARIERALARSGHPAPVRLHVLTRGPQPETIACTGALTCDCARCTEQRATLVRLGPRPQPRQPWDARRAA